MFENMIIPALGDGNSNSEIIPLFSIDDKNENEADRKKSVPKNLPVLALKNTVLFPDVVIPITVGRSRSVLAVKEASDSHKYIAVFSQKDTENESPKEEDLYKIGTIARIVKVLKMPDGTTTAVLQGKYRAELKKLKTTDPFMEAEVMQAPISLSKSIELKATMRSIKAVSYTHLTLPTICSV